MKRTAQMIAENQARQSLLTEKNAARSVNKSGNRRGTNPNSIANLKAHQFAKGISGNPSGRPKDVASALSRLLIEENIEQAFAGFSSKLAAGDAYAFSVLADRGYGKLKQGIIHTGDDEGGPIKASIKVEFVNPDGE